jgi:hypothetical protein
MNDIEKQRKKGEKERIEKVGGVRLREIKTEEAE